MRLLLVTSILLCLASCGFFSERQDQINFLYENSKLYRLDSVEIKSFHEENSGMFGKDRLIVAIYRVPNLDKVLFQSGLTSLGYRKLPASDLILENSFAGDTKSTDQGYYLRQEDSNESELIVILNFTRNKIFIYKRA